MSSNIPLVIHDFILDVFEYTFSFVLLIQTVDFNTVNLYYSETSINRQGRDQDRDG
jgi:hypothetical protein